MCDRRTVRGGTDAAINPDPAGCQLTCREIEDLRPDTREAGRRHIAAARGERVAVIHAGELDEAYLLGERGLTRAEDADPTNLVLVIQVKEDMAQDLEKPTSMVTDPKSLAAHWLIP